MREMCDMVLRIAAEVSPQVRLVFKRDEDVDKSKYNRTCYELERLVDTMRSNEGLETHFERIDDEKSMTLVVTFSEHEALKAIVDEIRKKARKLAKKEGIELE